jgi:hypothetical protein
VNRRVRVSGLGGAALAAVAATVLGAPAASAQEPTSPGVTERQVGAQIGSLPVQVGASVAVPGWLLPAAPENLLAVPGVGGQDLFRLDATRVYTKTTTPGIGSSLGVVPRGHDVSATTPALVDSASSPAAAPQRSGTAPWAAVDRAAASAAVGEVSFPRRAEESEGAFSWVPIGGLTGPVGGSSDHGTAGGLALLAVAGGAGAVVVVRRRLAVAG